MMGLHMSKPHLRAELEADLKRITEGTKDPKVVLEEQVRKYKEYFIEVVRQAIKLDTALSTYFNVQPGEVAQETITPETVSVMKCPKCQSGDITIKTKRDNRGFFLACLSFPTCNAALWLPESVEHISVIEEQCQECLPRVVKKVKFKFKPGSMRPFYPDELEGCLGGCDSELLDTLGARPITAAGSSNTNQSRNPTSRNASSDSGYESANHNSTRVNNNRSTSMSSALPRRSQSTSNAWHAPQQSSSSSQQLPRHPFRPVPTHNNGPTAPSDDVVCNCGKKAMVLTVRKEGPTKGRQFYKCPEMSDAKCNFFLWKDDDNSYTPDNNIQSQPQNNSYTRPQVNLPSRFQSNATHNENSNGPVQCRCEEEAPLMTVRKEGPNTGKKFFTCSKGRDGGCGFFQWADDEDTSVDRFPGPAARGYDRPSAGPSNKRSAGPDSGGTANKRKCGLCGERGHNRKKCPQNR